MGKNKEILPLFTTSFEVLKTYNADY